MPASSEHAARIKQGLGFIADAAVSSYHNELVIAYFYVALHMFEAVVYDFTQKPKKRHFYTHGERTKYLSSVKFDPKHPLFNIVADYEALRGLSEQARYLSPAGVETYEPLRVPDDIDDSRKLFEAIKTQIESVYASAKKPIPWA